MENYKDTLGINLLNFNSEKLAGAGYFIKRIFYQLQAENFNKKVIIYVPKNLNVEKVFDINGEKLNFEIKRIAGINSLISRIFFEQTLFLFHINKLTHYYSPTPAFPLLLKIFFPRIKNITTIHDLTPFYIPDKYPVFRRWYVKLITYLAAKLSDKVITVSYSTKKDLINRFSVPKQKIFVVYNFIPELVLEKEVTVEKYFVMVSTIEPGKNLPNIIKSFYKFSQSDEGNGFRFYICGRDGWGSKEIYELVEGLGLKDKVVFTGYLAEAEKNVLVKNCFAMVYISLYEGFGIPPLEAMYYSKPSIVSDNSSLPEVVGSAGLLCNPNSITDIVNSMKEILIKRQSLIDHIPKQIKKFTPSEQLKIFIDAIYGK